MEGVFFLHSDIVFVCMLSDGSVISDAIQSRVSLLHTDSIESSIFWLR